MRSKLVAVLVVSILMLVGCANVDNKKNIQLSNHIDYEKFVTDEASEQSKTDNIRNEWQLRVSETIDSIEKIKETNIVVDDNEKTITVNIEVLDSEALSETELQTITGLVKNSTELEYKVVVSYK